MVKEEEKQKELMKIEAKEEKIGREEEFKFLISEGFLDKLEGSVDNYKKMLIVAVKLTNEHDWVDQAGAPYLQASGCEKIAVPFGISMVDFSLKRIDRKDEVGDFYLIETRGKVMSKSFPGREMEIFGTSSSRDAFFAKTGEGWRPQTEVDENNLKMSAYSNLLANGIKRYIGLRNMTWEEVGRGGISRGKVTSVEYKKGGKASLTAVEKFKELLTEYCQLAGEKDEKAYLRKATTFKSKKDGKMVQGKEEPEQLSTAQLNFLIPRLRSAIEKKKKEPKSEDLKEEKKINTSDKTLVSGEDLKKIDALMKGAGLTKSECLKMVNKEILGEMDEPPIQNLDNLAMWASPILRERLAQIAVEKSAERDKGE